MARLREPGPGAEHLTRTGLLIGTPAYLAPGLWEGGDATERSDIEALGVTLHCLLTGVLPRNAEQGTRRVSAVTVGGNRPGLCSVQVLATR